MHRVPSSNRNQTVVLYAIAARFCSIFFFEFSNLFFPPPPSPPLPTPTPPLVWLRPECWPQIHQSCLMSSRVYANHTCLVNRWHEFSTIFLESIVCVDDNFLWRFYLHGVPACAYMFYKLSHVGICGSNFDNMWWKSTWCLPGCSYPPQNLEFGPEKLQHNPKTNRDNTQHPMKNNINPHKRSCNGYHQSPIVLADCRPILLAQGRPVSGGGGKGGWEGRKLYTPFFE